MRRRSHTHPMTSLWPGADGVPLSSLGAGERGTIINLGAGHMLMSRMAALGFTPGAEVSVVQNFGRGPLIALVRGTRIALGRGEAGRIRVRRESP